MLARPIWFDPAPVGSFTAPFVRPLFQLLNAGLGFSFNCFCFRHCVVFLVRGFWYFLQWSTLACT